MSIRTIVNFDNQHAKNLLLDAIRMLSGEYRVEIVRHRPRRTDLQNKYFWPVHCGLMADWLSEQTGEQATKDQAHDVFCDALLRVPMVNEHGEMIAGPDGRPVMRTRGTSELDIAEFNQFLDGCADLLKRLCNIDVPEPREKYHEAAA